MLLRKWVHVGTKTAALAVVISIGGLSVEPTSAAPAKKRWKRAAAATAAPVFPGFFSGFKPFGFFSGQNAYASLPGAAAQPTPGAGRHSPSTNTGCLPGELRMALADVQSRFGPVTVVSTHRPGARIGGGHMSKHANCQAVDFRPAPGTYAAVAGHLRQTWNGGLGTYSSGHIHIDTGPNYRWHTGGKRR
jgi:hypothetical protein